MDPTEAAKRVPHANQDPDAFYKLTRGICQGHEDVAHYDAITWSHACAAIVLGVDIIEIC